MDYALLLQGCRKKDKKAQLEFYQLFCQSIYNSCLRILNHPQEAEEVMQECLLKALSHPCFLLDTPGDMEKWLKRTAINRAIDLYRKRKIKFADLSSDIEVPEAEDDGEKNGLQLEAIRHCLPQLPNGYRMIFTLRIVEGWEYAEIAAQMHLTESSVRSQLTRARQKLIQLIKAYQHENIPE